MFKPQPSSKEEPKAPQSTLDALHTDIMSGFATDRQDIERLEAQIT